MLYLYTFTPTSKHFFWCLVIYFQMTSWNPTFPQFLPKPHLIQDDDAITLQQRILQGLTEQGLIGHKAKQGIATSPVLEADDTKL